MARSNFFKTDNYLLFDSIRACRAYALNEKEEAN